MVGIQGNETGADAVDKTEHGASPFGFDPQTIVRHADDVGARLLLDDTDPRLGKPFGRDVENGRRLVG